MVKEIDWQLKIIQRIRSEGGYGKKWSTQHSVGVPDLITAITGLRGGVEIKLQPFIEVKLEKGWPTNTRRTIGVTEKQVHELNLLKEAGALAMVLVVVYRSQREVYLAPLPVPPRREPIIVRRDELIAGAIKWEPRNENFSISQFLVDQLY